MFDLNHKYWVATRKDIGQLIKKQNILKKHEPAEKPVSFKIFSELYVLYAELVKKLSFIYEHTLQVQKRAIVRTLVESATAQLMKLKEELKNLELSEYVYMDNALVQRKFTPRDLVIWRSPQFLYRRPLDIQNLLKDNTLYMGDEEAEEKAIKDWVKITEAIQLIQAHERARQSRVYKSNIKFNKSKYFKVIQRKKVNYRFSFKPDQSMSIPVKRTIFNAEFIKNDKSCDYLRNSDTNLEHVVNESEQERIRKLRDDAARKIQLWWRDYKSSKILKIKKRFKQELYGLKKTRKLKNPNLHANRVLEMYKNEMLKKELDENFVQLIANERIRLLQQRTPWMMEDISDHIRDWFQEFYTKTENFHPYPDPVKTGTVLVVIDETMTPIEFQETLNKPPMTKEEKKKLAEKKKTEKIKQKEKIKKDKIKDAKRRKKLKDSGITDIGYELSTSKPIENIEKTMKQFAIDWRNIDEYLNKNHDPIKEWVTEDELIKIHQELRALVDEYMRVEYELLRQALAKDQKTKYKSQKIRKVKTKKPKKRKKTKDMTGDQTAESLFNELKNDGIIEEVSHKDFDDFIADFNFLADSTRDEDNLTTMGPAKGDIKMIIQECMIGMGEFNIEKPKSILLIGPLNSGKKLLCNIIASEIDAVFINISPEKVYKYAENMNYFVHAIMKVAKAFQPTVLYIEEAHRVFWKKVPPDQKEINSRLLSPFIMKKILKPIKKDDRIVLLGTSNLPWSANAAIKRAFQKVLFIPKCDYGTSFLLWLELMTEYAPDDLEDYTYSALAKVLQAYNSGDIVSDIAETLGVQRRMRLKNEALQPQEFLEYFLNREPPVFPPEAKVLDKFEKWFGKSNKFANMRRKFKAAKESKDKKKK